MADDVIHIADYYECINCSQFHPVGTMCPTWLGELIEDQFLGNSSGEKDGKG